MRLLIAVLALGIAVPAARAQPERVAPPSVAERAAFYQRVARIEEPRELERLLREASAASPDSEGWARITLLLDRYFELDPARAVRFAGELPLPARGLVDELYRRLASVDVNEALAALSQLDDDGLARTAAFSVFGELGADERAFELVAASLHVQARDAFRSDAVHLLAEKSPRAAFEQVLQLKDPQTIYYLAPSIAGKWASQSPRAALEAAERVADSELRVQLRTAVLSAWNDADGLADYLDSLDTDALRAAFAGGAWYKLVQTHAARAADLAAKLPPSDEQRALLMQIASSYAQQSPEGALEWAARVDAQQLGLVSIVVRAIALQDPLQAFDLAGSLAEPARSQAYFAAASNPNLDERQFGAMTSRVLGLQDGEMRRTLLVSMLTSWASKPGNLDRALDWMLAAGTSLPPEAFERIAYLYAHSDPAAAAEYAGRVPQEARGAWIAAVGVSYANTDPQAALAFIERYRGDPAYDRAATGIAQQVAAHDPAAAARLLASVARRGPEGFGPEMVIARYWVERDPLAAAAWAIDLPEPTRNLALPMVTSGWAQRDAAAARNWALGIPAGEKRDFALMAVVTGGGAAAPDPALIAAIGNERLRANAAANAAMRLAATDVAEARRLADRFVTDSQMRERLEQMIDNVASGAMPGPVNLGIVRSPAAGVTFAPPIGVQTMPRLIGPANAAFPVRPPEPGLVPLPAEVTPALPDLRQDRIQEDHRN